jgi:hypothetical protein
MARPLPGVTSLYHDIDTAPKAEVSTGRHLGGSAPIRGVRWGTQGVAWEMLPGTWLAAALHHLIGRPVDTRLNGRGRPGTHWESYVGDRLMRRAELGSALRPGSRAARRVTGTQG